MNQYGNCYSFGKLVAHCACKGRPVRKFLPFTDETVEFDDSIRKTCFFTDRTHSIVAYKKETPSKGRLCKYLVTKITYSVQ